VFGDALTRSCTLPSFMFKLLNDDLDR